MRLPWSTLSAPFLRQGLQARTMGRMPVVYAPHGGGPCFFMTDEKGTWEGMRKHLANLVTGLAERPKAIVVVTAHWERDGGVGITSGERPSLIYDYYGFPPETYKIQWPAPGSPKTAKRVHDLLNDAGIPSALEPKHGWDHGVFIPLKVAIPDADIPTVAVSLVAGLDPALHIRIGEALAPLRDEGVFIIGSGMSFHNLRTFGSTSALPASKAFDKWIHDTVGQSKDARNKGLEAWHEAPYARDCHPQEEHLLPLMVCAGAAGEDKGRITYNEQVVGGIISGVQFG